MTTLGLYLPGSSLVHRAPAGVKLAVLVAVGAVSFLLDTPWQVGTAVGLVVLGYVVAGLSPLSLLRQARPLLWLLLAVGAFHVLVDGWARALVVTGVILLLVLLAGLVTLTTRTTELVETLVRVLGPLRRIGVDAERVGLLLALSIRSVPVVVGIAEEVRDAQRARGLQGSPRAYAVPLVIRSLRHADALGEALAARGVDD
ncbi:MAG TPA: energy-coupling factor transporter transmembrane protein EcfT [Marmoricola sp.]|nr:energy-coupling factor transporter transmembrane protein EcfT [Marmoricola sp.]